MPSTPAARDLKTGAAAIRDREAPLIDHHEVRLDLSGHHRRSWFIRLPDGFVAGDLGETAVWARVQSNPITALRRHDRLYLVAFDESWVAEAIVTDATAAEVSLARPRIIQMASRVKPLFNDGTYRVAWHGNGYVVLRNADNQAMTNPVQSLAVAERELAQLYPRRPAA